jgi:hypothetical protein
MLRKLHRTLTLATMASLVPVVMMTTPVAAQPLPTDSEAQVTATAATPQPATALEQAGAPLSGWVELGPKQGHWYKFKRM